MKALVNLRTIKNLSKAVCFAMVFAIFTHFPLFAHAIYTKTETHAVTMSISLNSSNDFVNTNIEIFIDTHKIGSIKSGEVYTGFVELRNGTHTLEFAKKGSNAYLSSSSLLIEEDCDIKCSLKIDEDTILFDSFEFYLGCDEELSQGKPLKVVDAYNFTAQYQSGEAHVKRGSFKEYSFIDFDNEIKVEVIDFMSSSYKTHAIPEKISIDTDGKIHEYFYFENTLYELSSYGMIVEHPKGTNNYYYIVYDKNGNQSDSYKISFVSDPVPDLLKKSGFLQMYPTPSSFLNSDSIYPTIGKQ